MLLLHYHGLRLILVEWIEMRKVDVLADFEVEVVTELNHCHFEYGMEWTSHLQNGLG
jgi:hypothetical protein